METIIKAMYPILNPDGSVRGVYVVSNQGSYVYDDASDTAL